MYISLSQQVHSNKYAYFRWNCWVFCQTFYQKFCQKCWPKITGFHLNFQLFVQLSGLIIVLVTMYIQNKLLIFLWKFFINTFYTDTPPVPFLCLFFLTRCLFLTKICIRTVKKKHRGCILFDTFSIWKFKKSLKKIFLNKKNS